MYVLRMCNQNKSTELIFVKHEKEKKEKEVPTKSFWKFHVVVVQNNGKQGAKKIIFTACPLGKLKLTFTSPDVISTSPKNVLFFSYSNSS